MKQIVSILGRLSMGLLTLSLLALAQPTQAVPILQLYVEGAVYDTSTESWSVAIPASGTIRLWAIGNVTGQGGKGTISDVKLSIAYDVGDTPSFTLVSSTTGGYGGFNDPSTPSAPVLRQTRTDGSIPRLSDGSTLPSHGEYGAGTAWAEYGLGDFTLSDSPTGDFITAFPTAPSPGGSQINVYEITISGTDFVHFDLYDSVQAGNKARAVFAPFSHDGEGGGGQVPEGGSTAIMLGLALLGFGGLRRKLQK
jgi:hypothetical protein